jgi:integrase
MVSSSAVVTQKLGEERLRDSGEKNSSLQQQQLLDTRAFGLESLRRKGCMTKANLLEYPSILRLVGYLRRRNPYCWATVGTYIPHLGMIMRYLGRTPDELVEEHREDDEDALEQLFLAVDQEWLRRGASPSTRIVKWSCLNTFLKSNSIRKVRLIEAPVKNQVILDDEAMTQEGCRKVFRACRSNQDRLLVSLLVESLQRAGTIGSLTWGDVREHIAAGETCFLVKIGAGRTKRNIVHWAPVGVLSSYYIRESLKELKANGIEPKDSDPLIMSLTEKNRIVPVMASNVILRASRILERARIRGRRFGDKSGTRYERHAQSFRKFARESMQNQGADIEAVEHLMGHKTSTYSKWLNRKDMLLDIYRRCMPRLDEKDTMTEVVDFARSRGFTLDPKTLSRVGEIRVDQSHSRGSNGIAA